MPPTDGVAGARPLAREVIYVIDTSGSMAGPSIAQARDALNLALDRLRAWDRFNIIEFNSSTHTLFRSARVANPKNLRAAKRYVASLKADGGTEMRPALEQALVDSVDSSLVRQIVFLTDGSVGNEAELFALIEQGLGRSRLYTVGIGPAPNSYFMRKAAQFGRGTFTYIGDVNEVRDKMTELFGKLESPIMTGVDVELDGVGEAELWPSRVPDLYLGEPVIVTARSRQGGGVFRVRGERFGAEWRAELRLDGGRPGSGVGVLWARSKIAALMDSLHEGADAAQVRSAVIRVALTHHLVSQYTSLVAVDVTPTRPPMEGVDRRAVPGNLPEGLEHERIFGRLPQTATPARLHLLIGALLLLAAAWVGWRAHGGRAGSPA
jgi:Ca-activated chloride channel family protein